MHFNISTLLLSVFAYSLHTLVEAHPEHVCVSVYVEMFVWWRLSSQHSFD